MTRNRSLEIPEYITRIGKTGFILNTVGIRKPPGGALERILLTLKVWYSRQPLYLEFRYRGVWKRLDDGFLEAVEKAVGAYTLDEQSYLRYVLHVVGFAMERVYYDASSFAVHYDGTENAKARIRAEIRNNKDCFLTEVTTIKEINAIAGLLKPAVGYAKTRIGLLVRRYDPETYLVFAGLMDFLEEKVKED